MVSRFCVLTDAVFCAAYQNAVTFMQPADSSHVVGCGGSIANGVVIYLLFGNVNTGNQQVLTGS